MNRETVMRWLVIAHIAILGGLLTRSHAAAAEPLGFKVIVHPTNQRASVTKKELANIFLKKQSTWSGGVSILPVDLRPDSKTRAAFSQKILQKSMSAVKAFWQQQVFAGKSVPPPEMEQAAAIEYVRKNAGAIAYVEDDAATSGLNVMAVLEK